MPGTSGSFASVEVGRPNGRKVWDAGAAVLVSSPRLYELAEVSDRCALLMDGGITQADARNLSGSAAVTGAALLKAFDALRP